MKKFITVCLLTVVGFNQGYTQTKYNQDTQIDLDLLSSAGPFPGDFEIKKGVRIRYKITNFNRNVYTISVNSEARTLFADKPPILGIVSDIDLTKLTPKVADGEAAAAEGGEPLEHLIGQLSEEEKTVTIRYLASKTDVNNLLSGYHLNNNYFKNVAGLYRSYTAMLDDGLTDFNSLLSSKLAQTDNVVRTDFAYAGSASDENALLASLRGNTDRIIRSQLSDYTSLIRRFNQMKINYAAMEQLAKEKIKKLTAAMSVKGTNKRSTKDEIANITFELTVEKLIIEGIAEVMEDIKIINSKMIEYNQEGFAQALETLYRRINKNNWTYISPSIKGQKDQVIVKISIDPKVGSLQSANYGQFNGEYTGDVYGFKINFSTGLFLLVGKKIFDQSYKVDTIAGDLTNKVIIRNKNRQSLQPAVGALMHFYNKQPGSFSWGGHLGFSVSSETRLNYHGGVSFLFGQEQRVVVNIGAVLTQVQEISREYEVNQKVTRSSGFNTVPTENFYRMGGFLALTYNLSN
jgi:hypothetical protein